jgi:hypothetical protein
VVLAGGGLVSVGDYLLARHDTIALLVAEPLPSTEASVGVELALTGATDALWRQLRRHAAHPAVDALVVVSTRPRHRALPPHIDGVPLRTALITPADPSRALPA